MTGVVVMVGVLVVVGVLWYVWRHRSGVLAKGVGAAGARYNELYGQGGPPRIQPPAGYGSAEFNDSDSNH